MKMFLSDKVIMTNLKGKKFTYMLDGKSYLFYITRDYPKAIRVTINNTSQAVWIPKYCLQIKNNEIIKANIKWKIKTKEFQHKLILANKIGE